MVIFELNFGINLRNIVLIRLSIFQMRLFWFKIQKTKVFHNYSPNINLDFLSWIFSNGDHFFIFSGKWGSDIDLILFTSWNSVKLCWIKFFHVLLLSDDVTATSSLCILIPTSSDMTSGKNFMHHKFPEFHGSKWIE